MGSSWALSVSVSLLEPNCALSPPLIDTLDTLTLCLGCGFCFSDSHWHSKDKSSHPVVPAAARPGGERIPTVWFSCLGTVAPVWCLMSKVSHILICPSWQAWVPSSAWPEAGGSQHPTLKFLFSGLLYFLKLKWWFFFCDKIYITSICHPLPFCLKWVINNNTQLKALHAFPDIFPFSQLKLGTH